MGQFSAAGELGALIVAGIKTATCSALRAYEAEREPLPSVGLKTIVLDGNGDPLCIVETTQVKLQPYDEVEARIAFEEGEGGPFAGVQAGCALTLLLAHAAWHWQGADCGYAAGMRAVSCNP